MQQDTFGKPTRSIPLLCPNDDAICHGAAGRCGTQEVSVQGVNASRCLDSSR